MKFNRRSYIYLLTAVSLTSCFEKDKPVSPFVWDGQTFIIEQSIYTHQIFFNIGTNSIVKSNQNEDWDLSFESSVKGWHIRVNSSNFLNISPTQIFDFSISQFPINEEDWRYDKSNGDPDSTAVSAWVDTSKQPYSYSGQVYLIGQYDGTRYKPLKKLLFTLVNDSSYNFTYADLNGDNTHEVFINKDSACNYSYFSITTGQQVKIEPTRKEWELLFTQYETTLFDNGKPVPYFVRGVLINPYQVKAAVDSSKIFENISMTDVPGFSFKTDWDAIGYNWKSVIIDIQSNSAKYSIRSGYNYIIRDVKGNYYKLRFVSFYNKTGEEGYPTFDFLKL